MFRAWGSVIYSTVSQIPGAKDFKKKKTIWKPLAPRASIKWIVVARTGPTT